MNTSFRLISAVFAVFLIAWPAAGPCAQESEIQKAKIYLEIYPLLNETDLYCSFFIWDGPPPELRIAGAERDEFALHADGEVIYLRAGRAQGVEVGQKMLAVEVGPVMSHPGTGKRLGPLCFRRGIISVFHVEEDKAAARIEKTCSPIQVGNALVPFEVRESVEGKNEGFVPYQEVRERLAGAIIYLAEEINQAGPNNWVLIDLGREQGLRPGQQLTIFKQPAKGLPRRSVGNGVVVDLQERTATMRILSADDAVVLGDGVEVKESL